MRWRTHHKKARRHEQRRLLQQAIEAFMKAYGFGTERHGETIRGTRIYKHRTPARAARVTVTIEDA